MSAETPLYSFEFSALRFVLFERRHLALHEAIEHWHRERGFAVPLAPDHAFVDELLFDIDSADRAAGRSIPDLESPFLKKIGIALRHAEHFREGVIIEKNTLVLGRVNQRILCRCEFERPHL